MAHGQGLKDRLALTQSAGWRKDTVNRISGLSYTYRDVAEVSDDLSSPDGMRPGDRAPDVSLGERPRLFDLLRHPRLTALLMPASANGSEDARCRAIIAQLHQRFAHVVKGFVIADREIEELGIDQCVKSDSGESEKFYGSCEINRLYLVRPDGYVAFNGELKDSERLFAYLERWFHAGASR